MTALRLEDASMASPLAARELDIPAGDRVLVSNLTLDAHAGEIIAVLGRNGAGKTLTLHTLAGLRAPPRGDVLLAGAPLRQLTHRAVARHLGVLFQDLDLGLTTSVLDAALVGRYPHLPPWRWESQDDLRLARDALARVGLEGFETRDTATLSGGEQRRLALATLLVQDPRVLILDEPTNHLDPHHQLAVFELLRELAAAGRTIIATLHDPTLAARYADRVLLLFGDGTWRAGSTAEVLAAPLLSELYLTPVTEEVIAGRRIFLT